MVSTSKTYAIAESAESDLNEAKALFNHFQTVKKKCEWIYIKNWSTELVSWFWDGHFAQYIAAIAS